MKADSEGIGEREIITMVAVVALRQLRPLQSGRNEWLMPPVLNDRLRRWTRRYPSQRDEFHHPETFSSAFICFHLRLIQKPILQLCWRTPEV